ncbi:MAG: cyclopropane-fatty-acyl-phospholipid synthase family protein [Thermodesulfobacteriota bacterium]
MTTLDDRSSALPGCEEAAGASGAAIRFHYDLGASFYQLWLGSELTYSCAMFEEGDDLEAAQRRKIDYHARQSGAVGARSVLDVGCGWGSTMRRLVECHRVGRVTGLTLSRDQKSWIEARRPPRATALLEGWQQHEPGEPYDAILSIGAFEHFVRRELPRERKVASYRHFFTRCREWLRPGGAMSLQTIAYGTLRPEQISPFITTAVFPESDLPFLGEIVDAARGLLEITRIRNDRSDYARTCREWVRRLGAHREAAERIVGSARVADFERFLRMSAVAFERGGLLLLRITLRKGDD